MKINLISCDTPRPDRRGISNYLTEISSTINSSLANELTDILLEGDAVEIEIDNKNTASALRGLRKLSIDYEVID